MIARWKSVFWIWWISQFILHRLWSLTNRSQFSMDFSFWSNLFPSTSLPLGHPLGIYFGIWYQGLCPICIAYRSLWNSWCFHFTGKILVWFKPSISIGKPSITIINRESFLRLFLAIGMILSSKLSLLMTKVHSYLHDTPFKQHPQKWHISEFIGKLSSL